MRLMRRVFNLHGSAVNNAAASVRADNAARNARHSAAEAVELAASLHASMVDLTERAREAGTKSVVTRTRTQDDQGPAG